MQILLRVLRRLLPGWDKSFPQDDLPLITEILSLVDYSLAEGKPLIPGQTADEIVQLRRLLERAIYEVLWEADDQTEDQAALLETFTNRIESLCDTGCGVITTNYDTCVEQELFDKRNATVSEDFDFGFGWLDAGTLTRVVRSRPAEPRFRWFKLHGSLNWARCPACEHLYINPEGDIAHQTFRKTADVNNVCHCGRTTAIEENQRLQLHLVAPSMYRTVRDANLLETWKNSLQLLIEAKQWIIIGYSLPSEDIPIRSMLVRAYHARPTHPKVTVVQYGRYAEPRYRLLFPQCRYLDTGLGPWLAGKEGG